MIINKIQWRSVYTQDHNLDKRWNTQHKANMPLLLYSYQGSSVSHRALTDLSELEDEILRLQQLHKVKELLTKDQGAPQDDYLLMLTPLSR